MRILEIINPTNTGAYNRPIAHALGLEAAAVYSALIAKQLYYAERNMLDKDGWFYSTVADLQESTTLKKDRQSKAVKKLCELKLIETDKRGTPARRCFRVCDDTALLAEIIAEGEKKMTELNPIAQKPTASHRENRSQDSGISEDKSAEIAPHTINPKINKSRDNNPNLSITPADRIDTTDIKTAPFSLEERNSYLDLIRENIEYDCFGKSERERVDELVEIMLDIICSTKSETRVNGENVKQEVVKSRFLKLNHGHIDYVLLALRKNTSKVHNIHSYIITALYNAPTTSDSYYTALVNHDLYGTA